MSRGRTTDRTATDSSDHCLRGVRILIAEDEILIALDIETTLTDAGAEVVGPVHSVADALTAAQTEVGLAAAILDITLGRVSIAPVARRLHERGVPFLFYTGQEDVRIVATEWPDSPILTKPVLPRVLVRTIATLL